MNTLLRRARPFVLPATGVAYATFWVFAESGRYSASVQGLGWRTIVVVGFAAAIAIGGAFPRSAMAVALASLALSVFLPTFFLTDTSWPAQLATVVVCAVGASRESSRLWSAGYGVLAVVLMDIGLITTGVFVPSNATRDVDATHAAAAGLASLTPRPFLEAAISVLGVLLLVMMIAAWLLGTAVDMLRKRAEQRWAAAAREGELRAAERELAAAMEHERIAREIHDVVAHSLASMVAQADGARFRGGDERAALATIAERGRESLVEVRKLLDDLEADGEGSNPGIEALPSLLDRTRAAGLDVLLIEDGGVGPLTAAQRRAAYRIVQECLTNALRHADREPATELRLEWRGPGLAIEIVSPRRGDADAVHTGRGIVGMQERARLAGGWLAVDAEDDRGFVVTAYLPYAVGTAEPTAGAGASIEAAE